MTACGVAMKVYMPRAARRTLSGRYDHPRESHRTARRGSGTRVRTGPRAPHCPRLTRRGRAPARHRAPGRLARAYRRRWHLAAERRAGRPRGDDAPPPPDSGSRALTPRRRPPARAGRGGVAPPPPPRRPEGGRAPPQPRPPLADRGAWLAVDPPG